MNGDGRRSVMNEADYRWKMLRPSAEARLPGAVREVVRLLNEPKASVALLAAAVAKHQTLAESVLRKANVSTFGVAGRVKSLNSAVVMLGLDVLRETSRGILVASAGKKLQHDVMLQQTLWEHSIGCAIVAHTLASRSGKCNPADAFLAGLLHDVGALFHTGTDRQAMNNHAAAGELGVVKPTLEGMTRFVHAHVGADKAEEWGMARDIVEAIRFHHLPRLASTNIALAGIVHLAEFVCHRLHIGAAAFEQADHVDEESLARLGVLELSSIEALLSWFSQPVDGTGQHVRLEIAARELNSELFSKFNGLREEQRLVLALYYFEGLSVLEIGQLLEMSVTGIEGQLSDALRQLQNVVWDSDLRGFVEKI